MFRMETYESNNTKFNVQMHREFIWFEFRNNLSSSFSALRDFASMYWGGGEL